MGTAIVAPLNGRHRLGVVVGIEPASDRAREAILSVVGDLSLPPELVRVCERICENAAVPLPVVLRAALPPALETGRYRVLEPSPDLPWGRDSTVARTLLKRALGPDGLRAAEVAGRIELAPEPPGPATVEWVIVRAAADPDLTRAPRQRDLFETLQELGGAAMTSMLLSNTGAHRSSLRELVRRGAVRLVRRPEPAPLLSTRGDSARAARSERFLRTARRAVDLGGVYLWRRPSREEPDAVAALVRATLERGEQALVLAPEIGTVEELAHGLRDALPVGYTVAAYHSGVGRGRWGVYESARKAGVDVVVGTRTAALLPLARPGMVCVVDEPNEAHRPEPGHEGLPLHVRDVALERARLEGAAVFCLSPVPSLRIYAPEVRRRELIRNLPPPRNARWPAVRIVDMRGSGAVLSSTLIDTCRRSVREGGRVGLVANRLGYASSVSCNRCGAVKRCPSCGLPLALHGPTGPLICPRCGYRENAGRCAECGSDRVTPTGMAVERVRETLASALGEPIGLITAERRDLATASVVVGTARRILDSEWHTVMVPDADAFLLGSAASAVERAFRLLYGAAEAASNLLVVQTRLPEHYALRAAVRGDYEAFAAAELPRLRALGYPPSAHLASLTFEGPGATGAVESRLRPALEPGVEMSEPVATGRASGESTRRVLLRSRERTAVARAASLAARMAARTRGLTVRVDVDPEEV